MQCVAFIANLFCFHLLNLYVAIFAHARKQSLNMKNLQIESLGKCHCNELWYSKHIRKEKQSTLTINIYWEYQAFR